jgi:hypothetical protein
MTLGSGLAVCGIWACVVAGLYHDDLMGFVGGVLAVFVTSAILEQATPAPCECECEEEE